MRRLKPSLRSLSFAALVGLWCSTSHAGLVTSTFSGNVSGYNFGFLDAGSIALDDDYPVGTAVTYELTYDDGFLGQPWYDIGTIGLSGSLDIGARQYAPSSMSLSSAGLEADLTTIRWYGFKVAATGPDTSDGADFFGMFLYFAPDLSQEFTPSIGYGWSSECCTSYAYLETTGVYSVRDATAVPEPATLWLMVPALVWLRRRVQSRRG